MQGSKGRQAAALLMVLVVGVGLAGLPARPAGAVTFVQQARVIASDGTTLNALGQSVAVSGDTVVAGAPRATVAGNGRQGAVYVFQKPAGGWASATETAKLTASTGGAGHELGFDVAVSGDTVVASDLNGVVHVFEKPAGGWQNSTETAKLTSSDTDGFGRPVPIQHVAVSGSTVVGGALDHTIGGNSEQGSLYVFERPASGWQNATETAELTASDGKPQQHLGQSVGIYGDTVVGGADTDTVGANQSQGSVYLFEKPAGGWQNKTETAKLTASDGAFADFLGTSVGISGEVVVAGASGDDVGSNQDQGSAYVFAKPLGGWQDGTEAAKLTASDGSSDHILGDSVSVSGTTVVAGALGSRSAYVFEKPAGGWQDATETTKLNPSGGSADDSFADSVAVSGDTVVGGAPGCPFAFGCTTDQGSAYVFGGASSPPKLLVKKHVINDNGGETASASDFTITVTGSNPSPASFPGNETGTEVTLDPGSYSVSESGPGGYAASLSPDCSGTIAAGEIKTCTITNDDVDDIPPDPPTLTDTDPDSPANDNSPNVKGSAEAGSTVRLYNTSDCSGAAATQGAAADLGSPGIAVSVADDTTTEIRATATDDMGNASNCSAPIAYTEDSTPPETRIDSGPAEGSTTNDSAPTFGFSSSEPGATFQCRFDQQAFETCDSGSYSPTPDLADGQHTFEVKAKDRAGNEDPTPAKRTFTVDAALPEGDGRIVFSRRVDAGDFGIPANWEIYALNPDGTGETRLTNHGAIDDEPAPSSDGSKIAFVSDRAGNDEIYVMNADGTGVTRLTNDPADDNHPYFSPDASKIVFSSERDGNGEIYVMNADGTGQTRLTTNPKNDFRPVFSPDGSKVAFQAFRDDPSGRGNGEIYVMNADGTGQTRLTTNPADDRAPAFSPTGSRIAFNSNRDGDYEIYVMRADGTGQTPLTSDPEADNHPSFSPDGSSIVFISRRHSPSGSQLYVMNRDGSGQTRLTDDGFDGEAKPDSNPTWGSAPPSDENPPSVRCDAPDGSWHASDVSIACTAADEGSGLADATDASFSLSTNVPAGTEDANASTNSRQVCDRAGNCATAGPIAGSMIDKKGPSVSIVRPGAATYLLNEAVSASYSCADGGSGVASCSGPVADGAAVDTASVGTKSFPVSATDEVGNTASRTATYAVAYDDFLLYDPAKPTRRIKLQLHDANGANVSSPATVLTVQSIDGTKPAGGTFSYSKSAEAYQYAVDTRGLSSGSHTLEFKAGDDPTVHSVPFEVR